MFKKAAGVSLVSTILLSVILVLSLAAVTYAVWTTTATASADLEVPVDEYNPSEKYIVWRGIDNGGNFSATPTSYAVVGYDGLVAELIIPSSHNDLPVTMICVDESNYSKRLAGNPIVTSMVIPESVTSIKAGACKDMSLLSSVVIQGNAEIEIGDLAFANCPLLTSFSAPERSITGSAASYLLGSPRS